MREPRTQHDGQHSGRQPVGSGLAVPAGPAVPAADLPARPRTDTSARLPADGKERPTLPQRRVQQSLAPQLRDAPPARHDEPNADHTPDLMASFLRGVSRSDEENNPVDSTGGTS
jgi:hypothetical protein